jgi:hypothetical protein
MINWKLFRIMIGSGPGLIVGDELHQNFMGGTEKTPENTQSEDTVFRPKFQQSN